MTPQLGIGAPSGGNALAMIRARRALDAAGVTVDAPLQRVSSVTNEVWFTPDLVLRINSHPDQRLGRERIIASHLPPEVGYPKVVSYGGDLGADWLIVERLPGLPLSRCWPTLTTEQRREAIDQLARRLRLLHQVSCPDLPALRRTPQLLDRAATGDQVVARLRLALGALDSLEHLDPGVIRDLRAVVDHLAPVLDGFDVPTLVHGDLTFENVLWDPAEGKVRALLDFEWSRPAPPDLDLDILMRFVTFPQLHVPAEYEHLTDPLTYEQVPWWLAESYPELFSAPRLFERMRLYAIAWDVQEVLDHPPKVAIRRLHPHHPWHRLHANLLGTSYLDTLNRAS